MDEVCELIELIFDKVSQKKFLNYVEKRYSNNFLRTLIKYNNFDLDEALMLAYQHRFSEHIDLFLQYNATFVSVVARCYSIMLETYGVTLEAKKLPDRLSNYVYELFKVKVPTKIEVTQAERDLFMETRDQYPPHDIYEHGHHIIGTGRQRDVYNSVTSVAINKLVMLTKMNLTSFIPIGESFPLRIFKENNETTIFIVTKISTLISRIHYICQFLTDRFPKQESESIFNKSIILMYGYEQLRFFLRTIRHNPNEEILQISKIMLHRDDYKHLTDNEQLQHLYNCITFALIEVCSEASNADYDESKFSLSKIIKEFDSDPMLSALLNDKGIYHLHMHLTP